MITIGLKPIVATIQMATARMYRGSRKHVLDWTESPNFVEELLALVRPVDATLRDDTQWMPRGYKAPEEARLETFGPKAVRDFAQWPHLHSWWLAHTDRNSNTPNWDIAMSCNIGGRAGLILVEAKANVPELGHGGKPIKSDASSASRENHQRIGLAISEACNELRRLASRIQITRDSHYQLANRVAFGWKLASMGIPTIVVYLGFIGDSGIRDAGEPFANTAHWNAVLYRYAHGVGVEKLLESRVDCGSAPFWLLSRTKDVLEPSPSVAHIPDLQ